MQDLINKKESLRVSVKTTLESVLLSVLNELFPVLEEARKTVNKAKQIQGKAAPDIFEACTKFTTKDQKIEVKVRTNGDYIRLCINNHEHVRVYKDSHIHVDSDVYDMIDLYVSLASGNTLYDLITESAKILMETEEKNAQQYLEKEINEYSTILEKLKGPVLEHSIGK